MKTLLLSVLTLAVAATAHADLTITQKLVEDQAGKATETTLTMKVKGEKMRMDGIPMMSNIVDLKSGDVTTLLHQQKAIVTIPGATVKGLQDERAKQGPKMEAPKATGNKETISGFACEEYEASLGGAKIKLWLTKDLPAVEKLMKEMAQTSAASDPLQGMLKDQNISGFPMRTVMFMPGKGKMTMTVVALSEDVIPDADFATPADYKPMALPTMPGGR